MVVFPVDLGPQISGSPTVAMILVCPVKRVWSIFSVDLGPQVSGKSIVAMALVLVP